MTHQHSSHSHHKENLFKVFRNEKVEKVPWVPFAGAHAGKLKNYSAIEIFKDENKLLESILAVNKFYHPDGQPVMFDLQIEAEVLGCELKWHEKGPPSVQSHPLKDTDVIPNQLPTKDDGRIPFVLNVMKRFKEKVGVHTALFGLTCGPLTLAAHLRGTQFFIDLIRNKEYAIKLLDYTTQVNIEMAKLYSEVGMDIIATVDPVVSQISPRMFKKFLVEPFKKLFDYIHSLNKFSSFFVCGDATNNLDLMCQTGPQSIFVDENIDMVKAREIFKKHNVVLGGNIPLTTVMLYGTQQDNMKYVIDLMDKIGTENLVIAPGCDMPYDIPMDNVVGVLQAVQEPEKIREALKNYESIDDVLNVDVKLPDYENLEKPLIEVYTLDSDTCAACGYMKAAAFEAKNKIFGDKIDVIEYKITEKENIIRVKKLGLKHLPSMLINGKLKYSSIIPNKTELVKEIEKVLKKWEN